MQKQLQSPQQQTQNGHFTNNNNNLKTLGPLDTEVKNRANDKISPCANDLSGKWRANDGGVYYIAQKGNCLIRWFGSTLFNDDAIGNAKGFAYANEARGAITNTDNETQIILFWNDIKISDNHLAGTLTLGIDPSGCKLTKIAATGGGFGPSEWTRKC